MRILVASLACALASGCTASRVATVPLAAAACVDEGEVAQAPVDEATRNYQTAYSVCHSDPAFAASLYQQVVDHADPQSDLYSRASGRLDALQSALKDRKHPDAARQACDQAAKWARPTERVAVEPADEAPAVRVPMAPVAVAATESGPLPASWLPAPAAGPQSAVRGGSPANSGGPVTPGQSTARAGGSADSAWGCAAPAAGTRVAGSAPVSCTARQVGEAASACSPGVCGASGSAVPSGSASEGTQVAVPGGGSGGFCGAGTVAGPPTVANAGADLAASGGCSFGRCGAGSFAGGQSVVAAPAAGCTGVVAGEWAPFVPAATVTVHLNEPAFVDPPRVAVVEAPLSAPPLVVAQAPGLSPPPSVASARYAPPQYIPSRVRVVVPRRDPGAEFLGALFNVFGSQPVVRVYPQRTQRSH